MPSPINVIQCSSENITPKDAPEWSWSHLLVFSGGGGGAQDVLRYWQPAICGSITGFDTAHTTSTRSTSGFCPAYTEV